MTMTSVSVTTIGDLFPLPAGAKSPPPPDVIGRTGDSSYRAEWDSAAPGNWGLRLHAGVIGLDIDGPSHGEGKNGPAILTALEADLGELPPGPYSTRHGEGSDTHIRVFRIPEGTVLSEKVLQDIEIIQRHHRYMCVAPSRLEDGTEYAWFHPDYFGSLEEAPALEEVPELPEAWLDYLRAADDLDTPRATSEGVEDFLASIPERDCGPKTDAAIDKSLTEEGRDSTLTKKLRRVLKAAQEDGGREAVDEFLDALAEDYGIEYEARDTERAMRRALEAVIGRILAEDDDEDTTDEEPEDTTDAVDPESLWTCGRPEIEHVMASARRLKVSPWALLVATLSRAACLVPYSVQFRSYLGSRPLNLLFALSGDTGGGKTLNESAADEIFQWPRDFGPLMEARSGEAIPSAFGYIHRKGDEEKGIRPMQLMWKHDDHMARFGFDEVGRLNAMQSRQGATVLEYLKTGESGAELGGILASNDGVQIPGKQYRLVASLNVQPERAHLILSADEAAGGFAGRMLWAATQYEPFIGLKRDRRKIAPRRVTAINWSGVESIDALPEMEDAYDAQQDAAHAGTLDPMESHALLLQSKIACCLAVLAGRKHLIPEDWTLASLVMEHSRQVRRVVLGTVEAVAYSAKAAHGKSAQTVLDNMRKKREKGLTVTEAYRKLNGDQRPIWKALVKAGEASEW